MDAATGHGRRAIGWYVSFRPDGRWVSARSQSAAYSLTAIALAVPGLVVVERSWYWRTVSPHALPGLLLTFWCFCAMGATVAWQLWRAPPAPPGAPPERAPEPHISLTRWAIALVVVELLGGASLPDANVLVATLALLAVAGYHFGRLLVLGRRERTSGSVILRPRSPRRIGRSTRFAVPAGRAAPAPSWRWRTVVAAAAVLSAGGGLWALGAPAASATSPADGYPYRTAPKDVTDRWGFETRECTSYVAWRLNHDDHLGFTTHYGSVLWWNAAEWLRAARAAGIPADGDPAPGSVMVLQPGVSGAGPPGHVALVVRAAQGWVLVDDYNTNEAGRYARHWMAEAPFPGMAFLHFPAGRR